MEQEETREVWQRGPVEGIPALLQPVAHALLQALEDTQRYAENFPEELLWQRPGNVASIGFHMQHLTGVLDRLFTYARGESLTAKQLQYLSAEEQSPAECRVGDLITSFQQQVQKAIDQLKNSDESILLQERKIGRKQIPTTVLGLLFHAAEHSQRHVGQMLVTTRILLAR